MPNPHILRAVFAACAAAALVGPALAAPATLKLPPETAKLRPSALPGYGVATQKCATCHSADYIIHEPVVEPREAPLVLADRQRLERRLPAPRNLDAQRAILAQHRLGVGSIAVVVRLGRLFTLRAGRPSDGSVRHPVPARSAPS